tara:strand:+ start:5949 stop:6470 length:522 start_codon:yes stop_codon:yes gene_type:complete
MYTVESPLQVEQVLEVVASVNANDKICTQAGLVDVYKPTPTRGLVRWWHGESRFRNFTLIELVIRSAIQTVELASPNNAGNAGNVGNVGNAQCSSTLQPRLVRKLRDARRGLSHLMDTYRDDAATCSRLRVMLSNVDDFLNTRVTADTTELDETTERFVNLANVAEPPVEEGR